MPLAGLVKLIRPYYAVPMSLAYTLTAFYALGGDVGPCRGPLWLSTLSVMLAVAAGYAFNEICDLQIDRANPRRHPIARGELPPGVGWAASLLLATASAAMAASTLRWPFFAAVLAALAGLAAYDLLSKRLGWGKQLLAAALMTWIYPLAFAFAGWPRGPRAGSLAVFPVWLFITGVGYELLKDVRDCRTDPPAPHWAGPIRARPATYRRLAGGLVAGASPLLLLCTFFGCGWVYALGAAGAICLTVAAAFGPVGRAIRLVYAECFLVGLAAAADVMILGI